MSTAIAKRPPGSLAERFWSIARSTGPAGDDTTSPEPQAVVRHVLRILDALFAGEVGDGVSQATVSFLQMLRQQEQAGDLSYASPEQARGESLDERSLVFSVGVLLFEELTGRHPFGAMASGRRFARIQKCELGSGVQYFPKVPAQLRNVLMKAMGPFPEERYRSLAELRTVLEHFVDGLPEEALPGVARPRKLLKGMVPTPADLAFAPLDEKTTVMARKPPVPQRPPLPSQPLRAVSMLHAPTFGPAVPATASALPDAPALSLGHEGTARVPMLEANALASPRTFAVLERLAWVASGAFVALLVAWFALKPHKPAAPSSVGGVAVAAAGALPAGNLEPPEVQVAPPAPLSFDADVGGQNAAQAARSCFAPERASRTIAFGIGVMWGKDEPGAHRTFLSPDEPLSPEERRCVAKAMVGVQASAAPARATIVEYRLKLKPDGSNDVKAAIQK